MPKPRIVKRLIGFTVPASEWLVSEAKALGLSISELVRRAVDKERRRTVRR